ncbi:MAG TPA: hypothetical protein VMZ53_11235 [Kofleriaceae bacterium]|nr:hypothetical protein [Kofleriaceae bacterium]
MAIGAGACGTNSVATGLAIDRIEPASGKNDAPVSVDIGGSFHLPVRVNFDTGETVVSSPAASLGAAPLDSVQWSSEQRIAASVPAGLTPGLYDVTVALGDDTATLAMGYEVLTSEEPPPPPPAPPFMLTGANWLLPCVTNGMPYQTACTCSGGIVTQAKSVGGMAGERWHVTVRIRGVMEQMTYSGGTPTGSTGWYTGGTYGGGNNYYGFTVSAPASTYFLNNGPAAQTNSWPFDYQVTFDVYAGADVTFYAAGQDGVMWEGVTAGDQPISVAGVTDPAQPYNGQWARMDVIDAVAF